MAGADRDLARGVQNASSHNTTFSPSRSDSMRLVQLVTAAAAAALTLTACAPGISVRTALSPDASLRGLRTFRVLPTPKPKIAGAVSSTNDPMLVNSISNRALRSDLAQEFTRRGYVASDTNPDFCVAYYASTKQQLDVSYWDYGYAWRPRWWSGWGHRWGRGWGPDRGMESGPMVTQYTEGTVIVDVFDPKTKDLLWRGQGIAAVSDNEQQYEHDLKQAVEAIVDKFPAASTQVAVAQ
jgi:hypothetical protein